MGFPLRGRLLLEALWDCLHFDGRRVEKAETASLASIIEAHATHLRPHRGRVTLHGLRFPTVQRRPA